MGFRFPFETPPRKPIDDPETHLAALVVVITKLLFPFDGIPRVPDKATDPSALTMDWKVWQAEFTRQVKVEQSISEMTKEELDARVAQVIQGIGSRSSKNDDILQFFSQNGPESRPSTPGSAPEMRSASSINQSVQRILAAMDRAQTEAPDHRPGSHYEVYETEEDLPEVGRMFYAKCAEVAGLQLSTLIRSVVLVEKELAAWQKAQR